MHLILEVSNMKYPKLQFVRLLEKAGINCNGKLHIAY